MEIQTVVETDKLHEGFFYLHKKTIPNSPTTLLGRTQTEFV